MADYSNLETRLKDRLAQLQGRTGEDGGAQSTDPDVKRDNVRHSAVEAMEGVDDVLREEMAQIEAALGRIKDGSYGICTVCGDEIDEARLEARPIAVRCIKHAM